MILIRRTGAGVCTLALLALGALTACGTSTGPDGTQAAPVPSSALAPSTAPTTPAASASPTQAATASPAPAETTPAAAVSPQVATAAQVPAVANATDLRKAPSVSAGTGTPPTDLLIRDLVPGTGTAATATSTVTVQYYGANFADGKEFDSTWENNGAQPTSLALDQVIQGFGAGITGMKVGGRREIVIPPSLGYGDQANGPIVANETLVFVVDLTGVSAS